MRASRLRTARAAIVVDPATDSVAIRFDHDGDSFDAVQRALDLVEDAEAGERRRQAATAGGQARGQQAAQRREQREAAIRRVAANFAASGSDALMVRALADRFECDPKTIRRALRRASPRKAGTAA